MEQLHYFAIGALALYGTHLWAVVARRRPGVVPIGTVVSGVCWSVLAVTSTVTKYHQDGSSTTLDVATTQLVVVFLALISWGAFVAFYLGVYPDERMSHTEVQS